MTVVCCPLTKIFMKKIFTLLLICFLALSSFAQKVEPTWESLQQRGYPQWFSDAKLGIFIHWGVYSVPAFATNEGYAEWYYSGLMNNDSTRVNFQKKNYGEDFNYRDFDKMFKAELWNPSDWADLFKKSGAKYVLLVAKHHDGYCLWDSKYAPEWNSVVGGPKRNIVEELTDAVRAKDMKMGFYFSLPEWTNPMHRWYIDPDDSIANYVDNHMIPQFKELVTKYRPSIIFSDGEWRNSAEQWHAAELIAWYYNTVGEDAIVNDRWGYGAQYGFRTPEYSAGITQTDRPWAECRGIGRSFGLNRNEPLSNYLTSKELIRHFAKTVAAGGGMTLNVGPAADGIIPMIQQERLLDLGQWLEINGEAIYGTRPYHKFYEMKEVTLNRVDSLIDFNWHRNSPDKSISYDNFSATWTGNFVPEKTATYIFEVEVDDNVRLTVDDKVIIDYNPAKANEQQSDADLAKNWSSTSGKIKLKAGVSYSIKVEYEEKNIDAMMRLFVSSNVASKKDASQKELLKVENGFKAEYKCQQPYVCYTTKGDDLYAIAIDYPQDELVLEIPQPEENTVVTMLGCEKILPWKYEDDKIIIDTTPLKYNDLKSDAAWVFKISR